MTEPTTHTLDVPGAVLTYDVRRNEASTEPVLHAHRVADGRRRVRHAARPLHRPHGRDLRPARRRAQPQGRRRDRSQRPTSTRDDLHRLIAALGAGPVDLFASSGGAVNALALVASHPEHVRTLVAHEPPAAQVLPDREAALAATGTSATPTSGAASGRRWRSSSRSSATRARSRPTSSTSPPRTQPCSGCRPRTTAPGTIPCSARTSSPAPTTSPTSTRFEPPPPGSSWASGAESEGELAHRGGEAVAERLGTTPVTFPSGHGGFLGGEYGQTGEPDAFAAKLREVLDAKAAVASASREVRQSQRSTCGSPAIRAPRSARRCGRCRG